MERYHMPQDFNYELFDSIRPETKKKLKSIEELRQYAKGDLLFYEGKKLMGVFCIKQGSVKVSVNDKNGYHRILYLSKPGDVLGWEYVTDSTHKKEARALEDVAASFFPAESFLSILKEDNSLLMNMTRYICQKKFSLETRVMQQSLQQKLAHCLLQLKEVFGKPYHNKTVLNLPITRKEIASMIGTDQETMAKLLNRFKKQGIVDFRTKTKLIINHESLSTLINY